MNRHDGPRVAVFGAGAFGGWTALELLRRGARVTLVDAWGPGNVRASSGGETRIIRGGYGARAVYTRMAARALELWRSHDAEWQRGLFRQTGVLWMVGADHPFGASSTSALSSAAIPFEEMTVTDARRRYPQIRFDGVSSIVLEPDGGYLLARRACEHVAERFLRDGGEYLHASAASPFRADSSGHRVALHDGRHLEADAFVFACGPWLPTLFPDVVGPLIASTRQEVYYFGTPAGDRRFTEDLLPTWIDVGAPADALGGPVPERVLYGIPGNVHRGFKIADDTAGPSFDPSNGDRGTASAAGVADARAYLSKRFPDLANAPLLGAEVCQYESTPDAHFIIDRHPALPHVWIVGGGSGHGFKMGPAIGELVADLVLGTSERDPTFRLARFTQPPAGGWEQKWST